MGQIDAVCPFPGVSGTAFEVGYSGGERDATIAFKR